MIGEPWYWRSSSLAARAIAASLSPAAAFYDAAQRLTAGRVKPQRPPVPVICAGNATLGGVGKTPFVIMLRALLEAEGIAASFLTRGYGGREAGPVRVDPSTHDSVMVGDEALLLAAHGPTWASRDRIAGAKAAAGDADLVIMDDGYQNFSIEKTLSVLLIDAADPQGNGRVFPAGPLREPMARAVSRADIAAFVVANRESAPPPDVEALAEGRPSLRVWLEPEGAPAPERVIAFCGIGQPQRFFSLLEAQGFELAGRIAFPDHHRFAPIHLNRLAQIAEKENAPLITTEKDSVRLPADMRKDVMTLPVVMRADKPAMLAERILDAIGRARTAPGT